MGAKSIAPDPSAEQTNMLILILVIAARGAVVNFIGSPIYHLVFDKFRVTRSAAIALDGAGTLASEGIFEQSQHGNPSIWTISSNTASNTCCTWWSEQPKLIAKLMAGFTSSGVKLWLTHRYSIRSCSASSAWFCFCLMILILVAITPSIEQPLQFRDRLRLHPQCLTRHENFENLDEGADWSLWANDHVKRGMNGALHITAVERFLAKFRVGALWKAVMAIKLLSSHTSLPLVLAKVSCLKRARICCQYYTTFWAYFPSKYTYPQGSCLLLLTDEAIRGIVSVEGENKGRKKERKQTYETQYKKILQKILLQNFRQAPGSGCTLRHWLRPRT